MFTVGITKALEVFNREELLELHERCRDNKDAGLMIRELIEQRLEALDNVRETENESEDNE